VFSPIMFEGLARAGRTIHPLRSPVCKPLPRVPARLYGNTCVRGSAADCYRRIHRARRMRARSPDREPSRWDGWRRSARRRLVRAAKTRLAEASTPLHRTFQSVSWRQLRRSIPSASWMQWSCAFALPALLLFAGETSELLSVNWEGPSPEIRFHGARAEGFADRSPAPSAPHLSQPESSLHPPDDSASPRPESPSGADAEGNPEAPPPSIQDAGTQPFAALAMLHSRRSLHAGQSLQIHHTVQKLRAEAIREWEAEREKALEHETRRKKIASDRYVSQALQVAKLRYDGGSEATVSLELYDSFESLVLEKPAPKTESDLFRVCVAGRRSEIFDRYAGFQSTGGPIEITNYGYSGDYTPDTNSNRYATGLGGTRPLIPGISAALTRSMARKLDVEPGAVIEFLDGRGRSYLVTYDDRSPQGNLNIDVYRPTFGSNYFRAHVRAARVVRQGNAKLSHSREGLPFSLQNYRQAVLELAAEGRRPDWAFCEYTAQGRPRPCPRPPSDSFAEVETAEPLYRQLDNFADIPFEETGFETVHHLTHYLRAGSRALRKGVALLRKRGLNPAEFPPLRRIHTNLEAAQKARETLAETEVRLWNEFHDLEGEKFRIELEATLAATPEERRELASKRRGLLARQREIRSELEQRRGELKPAPLPTRARRPGLERPAPPEPGNLPDPSWLADTGT